MNPKSRSRLLDLREIRLKSRNEALARARAAYADAETNHRMVLRSIEAITLRRQSEIAAMRQLGRTVMTAEIAAHHVRIAQVDQDLERANTALAWTHSKLEEARQALDIARRAYTKANAARDAWKDMHDHLTHDEYEREMERADEPDVPQLGQTALK